MNDLNEKESRFLQKTTFEEREMKGEEVYITLYSYLSTLNKSIWNLL